ncbi:hypothetical protein [Endozoicomonas sp. 8E]|uniref:hypothetical protein n=1 Tax=Endozoicomonas sp. 8E TaxID=3035692 RepID=UPI0029391C02|nr:hypothetical protein [Endozoicomonas sp. 8E]WOG26957.1 hypothetical protein P6910_20765 [Endozoicomonas sp. 8E]
MSVTCQAKTLTRLFIVEFEQNADFPNQNVSVKPGQLRLSGKPSNIANKNGYAEPRFPSDKKRHRPYSYGVKTIPIESISWQWLYATNLLIAYELILTTKDDLLYPSPYLWLPIEAVVAAVWLLKSYWNPNSPLFNTIEQQAASIFTQEDYPFATITMMFGSGHDQQQYLPSASSDRQAPQATIHSGGSFSSPMNTDHDDGKGGSQKHSHTLDLDCFIYPCRGVCRFRPLSDGTEPAAPAMYFQKRSSMAEAANTNDATESLNDDMASFWNLSSIMSDFEDINWKFDPECLLEDDEVFIPLNYSETQPKTTGSSQLDQSKSLLYKTATAEAPAHRRDKYCDATITGEDGRPQQCRTICKNALTLSDHKKRKHSGQQTCSAILTGEGGQQRPCGKICKDLSALSCHKRSVHTEPKSCDESILGEDGQPRSCGKLCKNLQALASHRSRYHKGQRACNTIMIGENGQPRSCGVFCSNVYTLSHHKKKYHTEPQTCDMTVIGEAGQKRPCGKTCKSAEALMDHKRIIHSGRKTCNVTVAGKDDQSKPCGKVCKNIEALSYHKRRYHTGTQTCIEPVVRKDDQSKPCGKVCKNTEALSYHKRRYHTGPQTCIEPVVRKDGQPQPCRKVCNNVIALSYHKKREHTGPQTCFESVIEEDGQTRRCGAVCENAKALSNHKKRHRKRKPVNVGWNDNLSP